MIQMTTVVQWPRVVRGVMLTALVLALAAGVWAQSTSGSVSPGRVDLPTSKTLGLVPGRPQRVNSLPLVMAVSPDGRYVVTVNAGYGTWESKYDQSLAVMETQTGKVVDFPDERTGLESKETLYAGLAFSRDGRRVYASMASTTAPAGDGAENPGNGIAVYGFSDGKIVPERVIPIGLQPLAGTRRTRLVGGVDGTLGVPFPAGIAVTGPHGSAGERLLVADNLSDDVLEIDATTGAVITRFDLSESDAVPGTYPLALAVSKDGARAFVTLWNASEVVELNLAQGTVGRKLALFKPSDPVRPGSHPCALVLSPDERTLYVALSNRDAVAAIDITGNGPSSGHGAVRKQRSNSADTTRQLRSGFAVRGYFDTRLPGQSYFGAEPNALAVSADGGRVYAANMGSDAVAVLDARTLTGRAVKQGMVEPVGFIPTEWMPVSLTMSGETLFVATAKGRGTGPNTAAQRPAPGANASRLKRNFTYVGTLLYGSLAAVNLKDVDLKASTAEVVAANRLKAAQTRVAVAGGGDRIKHIIYLIRENRTYDQILGDLAQNGRPVGNGNPTLTMYGMAVTPNAHKLALQFGVLDNFFDSAEVSGDGHVWSNAAIGTDYLEKTWQANYRNEQRTYDYEGVVAEGYPLLQKIPDVVEPTSGYMWGNAQAHGKTHYNFGEYISSTFCDTKKNANSQEGPLLAGSACAAPVIAPGAPVPEEWGGGVNRWPWAIPRLASNVATKPELVGHFAPEAPDFDLRVPDQIRAEVFLKHFAGWVRDRSAGNDSMPNYITMRLGNDHTAGTTPGGPTPKASVADNDLALGRIVETVSHSQYWDDTAIFVVEDDAQNGADHVDAHRSVAFAISKYAPHGNGGAPFVDSAFYTTVSVVRTMESLLGLPPMNNNDALAPTLGPLFSGPGDQAPFTADVTNRENGLIYTANAATAPGAKASARMDFTHADRADARKLNVILWRDAKGDQAVPAQITRKNKEKTRDDDD